MKKTVAVILLLTTVTVFFCASVYGATANTSVRDVATSTSTKNNVTMTLNAVELYPSDDSYVYTDQMMIHSIVVVTARITNNNSKSYYVTGTGVNLVFNNELITVDLGPYTEVTNLETYGPDFNISLINNSGRYEFIPTADWSFGSNICIPANTTLSCVFKFEIPDKLFSNAHHYAMLDAITMWSGWNSYETDFTPQGAHDDLLISLEALRSALNSKLSTVNDELIDIEDVLTWTGTYNSIGIGNRSSATNSSVSNVKVTVRNFGSVPITDFEVLPPNVVVSDVLYKHPIQIEIETTFTTDQKINGSFVVNDFIASGSSSFDNPIIYSDEITVVGIAAQDGYYDAYIRYEDDVIDKGRQYNCIWLYVYSRSNYIPINSSFTVTLGSDEYTSDVESQSDSLVNQSNQAHSQEQQFFNQNSQAIANTGLGNYQFDINQSNGISVVTGLFNRLWNSLGSWNSVYFFSLTITVALTILRYTTNAIKRRSYTEDKGGKP